MSSESVTQQPASHGQGRGRSHGPRSTWDRAGTGRCWHAGPHPAGLLARASSAEAPGMVACASCPRAQSPTIPRAA